MIFFSLRLEAEGKADICAICLENLEDGRPQIVPWKRWKPQKNQCHKSCKMEIYDDEKHMFMLNENLFKLVSLEEIYIQRSCKGLVISKMVPVFGERIDATAELLVPGTDHVRTCRHFASPSVGLAKCTNEKNIWWYH